MVSTLLWAANGLTRQATLPDGAIALARSIPSAGALYPLEVYALCQRVNGVRDGLYHYSVWNHALEPVRPGMSIEDFREALPAPSFIDDANVLLFLAAIFLRTQRKYGPRGYRFILLEAGHAAQNICLMAVQAGLASLRIGG
jgi:SagB-type dehydrogenase family enzyme